jgi:hypothetical protein
MAIDKFIKKVCVQTAVYWGNPRDDGYGGMVFDEPIELTPPNGVRWEETTQKVSDGKGNEIISKAQILVNQDLDEQGYLFLGTLDELDSEGEVDPKTVEGAYEIKRFDKTPMIKSTTVFVRKAYL